MNVTALVNGKEITKMSFKQNKMIDHYNHLLYLQQTEELEDFPHHQIENPGANFKVTNLFLQ